MVVKSPGQRDWLIACAEALKHGESGELPILRIYAMAWTEQCKFVFRANAQAKLGKQKKPKGVKKKPV